ncbi:SOCS domain-containing protein stops [Halictus rubicundus]|uniref:SOCS domain-containing protein stops n=1 Tax=Halictus rubicundus TaxID=77578 RepID=UPI004035632B
MKGEGRERVLEVVWHVSTCRGGRGVLYRARLFAEMERSCLASRYKRREMVGYFSDVINSCAEAENLDKQDVCERIVMSALRYHNIAMMENGFVCMLGKFHNVLYVAAKLCYDWNLENNEIVARLLNDIFYCEKTFERIMVGAIFGTRVTHFLSGWKSDFEDREENIRALVYFLHHATVGRLEYRCESSFIKRRLIDVPMESYGQAWPLRVAIQHGSPDILLVMLRYGATVESDQVAPSPLEMLLTRLNEYDPQPGQDKPVYPEHLIACLRLVLRTITTAFVKTPSHIAEQSGVHSISLYEQYPALMEQNLIPPERSGLSPPELRHLCRCAIRERLFQNWALPHGIKTLQIPQLLRNYLDILCD